MNLQDFILVGGFVLTILTIVCGVAFLHGRGEAWREFMTKQFAELKDQLNADGPDGYVRRREITMLNDQADHEHAVINGELGKLRDRAHEHANILMRHEGDIRALKEGA